jgi:antitoxin component YwqK of YwqJK toxin-antitoxin module
MSLVSSKSTVGKAIWCKSGDGKQARWIQFYSPTDRRQSCGYSGGKAEGSFTAWHAGGKPWIEGEYEDGRKNGKWTQWDKSGAKVAAGEYRRGEFVAGAPVGIPALCEEQKL